MNEDFLEIQPFSPINKELGKRDWGKETLLHLAEGKWSMKKLFIKKGSKGGLQYHRIKNEAAFIVYGKLLIRYVSNGELLEKVLSKGDSIHFPPYCVHQEEAITDCLLVEVSTPHKNDRVRVEDLFKIKEKKGLPSTGFKDIEEIKTGEL